jgi:hypothetical protein
VHVDALGLWFANIHDDDWMILVDLKDAMYDTFHILRKIGPVLTSQNMLDKNKVGSRVADV